MAMSSGPPRRKAWAVSSAAPAQMWPIRSPNNWLANTTESRKRERSRLLRHRDHLSRKLRQPALQQRNNIRRIVCAVQRQSQYSGRGELRARILAHQLHQLRGIDTGLPMKFHIQRTLPPINGFDAKLLRESFQ